MTTAYTDALERALGRQLREYERAFDAYREKADAVLAGMQARLTDAELRCKAIEDDTGRRIAERLASLSDGKDGRDGIDGDPGRDGVDGANGKDGEPGRDGKDGVDGDPGKDADEDAILAALSERLDAKFAEVDQRVAGRLATVRDGVDGAPGVDGKSVDLEEVLGTVLPHIDAEVEARTAPKLAEIGEHVTARLAEIRDGADGKDGADGRDGKDADSDAIVERVSEALECRVAEMETRVADRLAAVRDGQDGAPGRDGVDGKDGKLPLVKEWAEGVHYAGDVVTRNGATWQAKQDTGREPPHGDWICLAAPGRDAAGFHVRGTFDPDAEYCANDIAMLDGSSFVALRDAPGPCPGEGWQLWAMRGKSGRPGPAIKGDPGVRGRDGAEIVGLYRDGDEIVITLSDGSEHRA